MGLPLRQPFDAVTGRYRVVAQVTNLLAQQVLAGQVVFDDQHGQRSFNRAGHRCRRRGLRGVELLADTFESRGEQHARPHAHFALKAQVGIHQAAQGLADGQPEPGTSIGVVNRTVELEKGGKNLLNL